MTLKDIYTNITNAPHFFNRGNRRKLGQRKSDFQLIEFDRFTLLNAPIRRDGELDGEITGFTAELYDPEEKAFVRRGVKILPTGEQGKFYILGRKTKKNLFSGDVKECLSFLALK